MGGDGSREATARGWTVRARCRALDRESRQTHAIHPRAEGSHSRQGRCSCTVTFLQKTRGTWTQPWTGRGTRTSFLSLSLSQKEAASFCFQSQMSHDRRARRENLDAKTKYKGRKIKGNLDALPGTASCFRSVPLARENAHTRRASARAAPEAFTERLTDRIEIRSHRP